MVGQASGRERDVNDDDAGHAAMRRLRAHKALRDAQRDPDNPDADTNDERQALALWTGGVAALFERVHQTIRRKVDPDLVTLLFDPDTAEDPSGRVRYTFTSPDNGSRAGVTRSFLLRDGRRVATTNAHHDRTGRRVPAPPETRVGTVAGLSEEAVTTLVTASLTSFAGLETTTPAPRRPLAPQVSRRSPGFKRRAPSGPMPKKR